MKGLEKVYKMILLAAKIILALVLIAAIIVPLFFLIPWLRRQGKKVTIYPKFEVTKVTYKKKAMDPGALGDAIKIGEDILKRAKGGK